MLAGIIWIYPIFQSIKENSEALSLSNRALKTLSECNQAIIHAQEGQSLMDEICRLIVEIGGYRFVWIGLADSIKERKIKQVARFGIEKGCLDNLDVPMDDVEYEKCPIIEAIKTGQPVITRFSSPDMICEKWREEALKQDFQSSISLPIQINNHITGALNIFSTVFNAFDDDEVNLLSELANDLSYATNALRIREQRNIAEVKRQESERQFQKLFNSMQEGFALFKAVHEDDGNETKYFIEEVNPAFERLTGLEREEVIGKTIQETAPTTDKFWKKQFTKVISKKKGMFFEHQSDLIGKHFLFNVFSPQKDSVATVFLDVTERKRSEELLRKSEERMRWALEHFPDMVCIYDKDYRTIFANPSTQQITGRPPTDFIGHCDDEIWPPEVYETYLPLLKKTFNSNQPQVLETDIQLPNIGLRTLLINFVPLHSENENVLQVLSIIRDLTEQRSTEEKIREQLHRLRALREIDISISGSMDLRIVMDILMEQCIQQLDVDAVRVLLYNPIFHLLEFKASKGFRDSERIVADLSEENTLMQRIIYQKKTVWGPNTNEFKDISKFIPGFKEEGFVIYHGTPLISKGQVKGVLEVFNRSKKEKNRAWADFFETLAGQAAIAIESNEQFNNLLKLNTELALAYDKTLEGWSSALDLRDEDTEGHTLRVTEMTLKLAKSMGINEEDLIQIKRGALLHDIGKMGIPDEILHKPGPLTKEERRKIEQHPLYAYDLIYPIKFLRPAINIPYCHHECWDGSGYPRGLAGNQIPLEARIFAIIDVWDALRSDRPYRKAWSEAKTINYIREQSGKHFDPKVVDKFLEIYKEF